MLPKTWIKVFAVLLLLIGIGAGGYLTQSQWLPRLMGIAGTPAKAPAAEHAHDEDAHSVILSEQARKNLGLETGPIVIGEFWRTLRIPGNIVEQPGHSHRKVPAPLTGTVRELYVHPNQLVRPGDPLAILELTGDTLATAQADLLGSKRELELNLQELTRVTQLVQTGTVPEKNKLQLEYERKRLESQLEARTQALQVLGLSAEQVQGIVKSGKLLREFEVRVPGFSSEEKMHVHDARGHESKQIPPHIAEPPAIDMTDWAYTVESIEVYPGKRVLIGEELCSLAFHVTLFIEGNAFEKESEEIGRALTERWPITATFESGTSTLLEREQLKILTLDNVVSTDSRTFHFYVPLANEVLYDNPGPQGEVYRSWRFRPGQIATLKVPVEKLTNAIVLPVAAVVREGPDAYVFRANGKQFERQSVQVRYVDSTSAVLANDGSLFPGEVVALNNAYQLNLALKKASGAGGGGHDHAGHNH